MGEPFDHCPPGWIRQSRKRCAQFIHNHMVVDYLSMSSVDFAISDLCSLIPNVPALAGNFLAGLHWKQNVSGMSGNHRSDFLEPVRGLSPDCRLQGSCPVV